MSSIAGESSNHLLEYLRERSQRVENEGGCRYTHALPSELQSERPDRSYTRSLNVGGLVPVPRHLAAVLRGGGRTYIPIYIYIYIYMFLHTHMNIYIYIHIHTHTHIYRYVCVYTYIYIYTLHHFFSPHLTANELGRSHGLSPPPAHQTAGDHCGADDHF